VDSAGFEPAAFTLRT